MTTLQQVRPGVLSVGCPDWCSDKSGAHQDQDYVRLVNDSIGEVELHADHAGPVFGSVLVEGRQNLVSRQWDYSIRTRWAVYVGLDDGYEELLDALERARQWIEAQG